MDKEYIAFISYRHLPLDKAVAEALHKKIERYVVPKFLRNEGQRHLGIVFRDRDELPLSSDLNQDIFQALDHSRYLIVVCTPQTQQSAWCRREIEYFISRHGHNRVFAVLAEGTPSQSIPPQLTQILDPETGCVTGIIEPLCADLTTRVTHPRLRIPAMRRKLREEFLRLVAGILGCPYDDLRQRQKRRAGRLMALAAAVSLSVITTLAIQNATIHRQNQDISAKNQEITEKNRQIEAQLAQTQLQQSDALSRISTGKLEEGDRLGAVESALQALPSQASPRPYYAPAEYALSEALYAYRDAGLGFDGKISQDTDIITGAVSKDGRLAVTMDLDGWLRCFDMTKQQELWSLRVRDAYSDPVSASEHINRLYILEDLQGVLCLGMWQSAIYSLEDGSLIRNMENWVVGYYSKTQFSPSGTWLAACWEDSITMYNIPDDRILSYDLPEQYTDYIPWGGAFSPDGRFFSAAYTMTDSDGDRGILIIRLDSREKTAETFYYYASNPMEVHTAVTADGSTVALWENNGSIYLTLRDTEGNRIYRNILNIALPESTAIGNHPADIYNSTNANRFVASMVLDSCAAFVFDNYLLMADIETGSLVCGEALPARCLWAIPWDGGVLYALENGKVYLARQDGTDSLETDTGFSLWQVWGTESSCLCLVPTYDQSAVVRLRMLDGGDAQVLFGAGDMPIYGVYGSDACLTVRAQNTALGFHPATLAPMDIPDPAVSDIALHADLSGNTLTWWRGTQAKQTAECPYENMQFVWPDPYWQRLETGDNGLIAMQHSDAFVTVEQSCPTTDFVIFSTEDGTWHRLKNPSDATTSSRICLAAKEKWMAMVDEYGVLRIYDQKQDRIIREYDLGITAAAVDQLNFVQEDRVLIMTQINGVVTAVNTDTGAILAKWVLEDYDRNCLLTVQDVPEIKRVFLCGPEGNVEGLCIETDSWCVVARIPGLACYLPASNTVIRISRDHGFAAATPLYSLEELTAQGRKLLTLQ